MIHTQIATCQNLECPLKNSCERFLQFATEQSKECNFGYLCTDSNNHKYYYATETDIVTKED